MWCVKETTQGDVSFMHTKHVFVDSIENNHKETPLSESIVPPELFRISKCFEKIGGYTVYHK